MNITLMHFQLCSVVSRDPEQLLNPARDDLDGMRYTNQYGLSRKVRHDAFFVPHPLILVEAYI